MSGSSPLARGLPFGGGAPDAASGIIPARAGFTTTGPAYRMPEPDHPRSRGVYCTRSKLALCAIGSSPLARGLLASRRARLLVRGIIPARAGFTQSGIDVR